MFDIRCENTIAPSAGNNNPDGVTAAVGFRHTVRMPITFLALFALMTSTVAFTGQNDGLIDDFSSASDYSRLGTAWRLVTDRVMGGVSSASLSRREIDGHPALCMQGDVSLDNNGGFVQVNIDLARGGLFDASGFDGVRLLVRGNGETYNLHLKTSATSMPWQSYRAEFIADGQWREVYLPFSQFEPHRLVPALDRSRLKRLGVVAIGRVMRADLCIGEIGFYQRT
ncbi:MAG: hypothetical protein N838_02565 [Thiohalocapsa sp. PB-PSB1]|jgi:hypothetical protein|nr:MAG: hypothetical protein N838_02565 [Thiohalocapsa sp. PB-PSB1]